MCAVNSAGSFVKCLAFLEIVALQFISGRWKSYLFGCSCSCLSMFFFFTCFHFRVNEKKKNLHYAELACVFSSQFFVQYFFSFFLAIVLSIMITTNAITIISKLMLCDSLSAAECFSGAL